MIEKLKNKQIEEVITSEVFHINDFGIQEVLGSYTEKTGNIIIMKPSPDEIVNKINEIIDALNAGRLRR